MKLNLPFFTFGGFLIGVGTIQKEILAIIFGVIIIFIGTFRERNEWEAKRKK